MHSLSAQKKPSAKTATSRFSRRPPTRRARRGSGCCAALGDVVMGVSFSLDLQGLSVSGWVSPADTVSVLFFNETAVAIDLASGTLRVRMKKM